MAFSRVATLLHAVLSDVTAAQHHAATVASDLNLADMAERLHASLASIGSTDHAVAVTQDNMESESGLVRMFRADRVRHSPGVAKAWVRITAAGAEESPSYNVASVTDNGTGDYTVVFDDDFSTDVFAPVQTCMRVGITTFANATPAVGSYNFTTIDGAGNVVDCQTGSTFYGDQ